MKTVFIKKEELPNNWVLIDANNQVLGRLASKIATILMGKDNSIYSPHSLAGRSVIVINVDKISVTGKKSINKKYYHHSGYPGGLKSITYNKLIQKKPDFPLKHAVKGMLPKNKLGRVMLSRLKIYTGDSHPHSAQKAKKLEI